MNIFNTKLRFQTQGPKFRTRFGGIFISGLVVVLWLTVSAPSVAAWVQIPSTPAGKRLAEFLAATESPDAAKVQAFVKTLSKEFLEEIPESEHIEMIDGIRQRTGGFDIVQVLESSNHRIVVVAKAKKTGAFRRIMLAVEPNPPFNVVDLGIREAQAPGAGDSAPSSDPVKSDAELVARLEKHLDGLAKADRFSGVVLVAKDGKPIFRRAYGLASREHGVPNREDTKFRIGSINKLFTEIAVSQLVAEGKLSLDDTIGKHLPDYPNKDAAQKVTIRHLLSMTSGIGDFFGRKYLATAKESLRTLRDFYQFFAAEPLAFEPGTKRMYSNGGFIVLGTIIEKVTGQGYYDYVRDRIFRPAGMTDTDHYESDAIVPNRASNYTRRSEQGGENLPLRNSLLTESWRGSSAGGGYSTADDLLKLAAALNEGKLPPPPPERGGPPREKTGTGAKAKFGGLGAAGGSPGVNAALEINVAGAYTVVVLSNLDPPSAEDVAEQIRQWLGSIQASNKNGAAFLKSNN